MLKSFKAKVKTTIEAPLKATLKATASHDRRSILSLTTSVLEQRATSLRFQPQQRLGESPSSSVAGAGDSLNDDEDDHCVSVLWWWCGGSGVVVWW